MRLPLPLVLWTTFVLAFATLSYVGRATEGKPKSDVLYQWSTFPAYLIQYAVIFVIVWGIAGLGRRKTLFAVRRPTSWKRAAQIAVAIWVGMGVLAGVLSPFLHPGREQNLTPPKWEPEHAAAYIANGALICILVPIVEELTFRGLGFSLLRRYGEWTAILLVGLLFGLAHGLVDALPLLVAFGVGLAFLRSRVDSVYPGMIVHGLFNAASLVFSVVH